MDAPLDTLLSASWLSDDIAMSMSTFGSSPFWDDSMQSLDAATDAKNDDLDSYFYLPPSIDSSSDTDCSPYSPYRSSPAFDLRLNPGVTWEAAIAPSKLTTTFDADAGVNSNTFMPLGGWNSYEESLGSPGMSPASSSAESERAPPTPGNDSPASSPAPTRKLRGAMRKTTKPKPVMSSKQRHQHQQAQAQQSAAAASDSMPAKSQCARQSHNLVEKKYRNRLNHQFELLLTTLSETRSRACDGSEMDMADDMMGALDKDRALSKSAVLQLARQTLLNLDTKNQLLSRQVEQLNAVSRMRHSMSGATGMGMSL